VGGALLVWRELTAERPAIDFRVLRHRDTWVGTAIGIIMGVGLFGSVFIIPVFLQGTLRMSVWQTGLIILPGAIATGITLFISGRIERLVDQRLSIAAGSAVFFAAMWQLAHLGADAGAPDFFWPLILRGLGLGLMFVPLTTVTLSGLDHRELPQGTGISNFFRQLGGSLGIALLATLFVHYEKEAMAVLATHLTPYDLGTQLQIGRMTSAFVARGADAQTAHAQALTAMQYRLIQQASVLAFARISMVSGLIMLSGTPLLLLVRKPEKRRAQGGAVMAE
jgi:DHA2 family multidrug resistance protein